uniref:Uncharacterized protein n=1 Tax=Arundo donax TaxID=35708 RepID=A0A0A9A349_ARUDO
MFRVNEMLSSISPILISFDVVKYWIVAGLID